MRKTIKTALIVAALAIPAIASAAYKYSPAIQQKWCWNNGTYWVAQRNTYPEYYAKPANSAYWIAHYGTGTPYCTP